MKNVTVDDSMLTTMNWRSIGPYRGGRVVAVAGHPTNPSVFYFGACGGGIWKTEDAGTYWENISDTFFNTAAVGAIAIAHSDPNIIYAGTGEACIRGNVSHGDGVYKSCDGGKTWNNIGLRDTRHIGRIRVHPNNPDLVYVAALGHAYGTNEERGIFRSTDGGKTWDSVLFKSNKAGAIDLSMSPQNPRILYASIWEVVRTPWSLNSGGPDSGLYRSIDSGNTWTNLTNNPGMPVGIKGRIGIAVSSSRVERIWAIVEAEKGGLLRSDDGGESWETVNDDSSLQIRPWYYSHVFSDPNSSETVYVLNTKAWKSSDGGHTFIEMSTPHGDNHDLWIDPQNSRRMIEGNDGGACVSLNGGTTWSSIYNQPTAQFYHVSADNQFPYRVYATQQDNSAVSIPTRSFKGAIHWNDCYSTGNSESGHIAVRPDDPNIVYSGAIGSSLGGGDSLLRYNHRTGEVKVISVWPELYWGWGAKDLKYRFQWTYPILISPHDPNVLYAAANVLFKTIDEGMHWKQISPDLTRNDASKMNASGGAITLDTTGVEHYCTIFAFSESKHEKGVLWCGSDDGLIHISKNGGDTWQNITPVQIPEWTLVSNIELSTHDPASAYVSATRYKHDDLQPYLYKTTDYGQTWTTITSGIPEHDFTRVIREDPLRQGLLYAGTETNIYVSFNDGASWQSLQQNLPTAPVLDLVVKDNDLVAATNGRSFWILDNLALLRQIDIHRTNNTMTLFTPAPTYRITMPMSVGRGSAPGINYNLGLGAPTAYHSVKKPNGTTEEILLDAGKNPPNGVVVSYYLQQPAKEDVTLTFSDKHANIVRSFSTNTIEDRNPGADADPNVSNNQGMNNFIWDMRYPPARSMPEDKTVTERLSGPLVPPGSYKVCLEIGNQSQSQEFNLIQDPRITTTSTDFEKQTALLLRIRDRLSETHNAATYIKDVRHQINEWSQRANENPAWTIVSKTARSIDEKLSAIEVSLAQTKSTSGLDRLKYPSALNAKLVELTSAVSSADSRPTQQSYEVFKSLSSRVEKQVKDMNTILETNVSEFIDLIHELNIPVITPKSSP